MKANHNKLNSKAQYIVATREGVSIKYKYMYITQLQINVILGIRHVFSTDLDRVEVKVLILSNNCSICPLPSAFALCFTRLCLALESLNRVNIFP